MKVEPNKENLSVGIILKLSNRELIILKEEWDNLIESAIKENGKWKPISMVSIQVSRLKQLHQFMQKILGNIESYDQVRQELFKAPKLKIEEIVNNSNLDSTDAVICSFPSDGTQKIYDSIFQAAEETGHSPQDIAQACDHKGSILGSEPVEWHWKKLK